MYLFLYLCFYLCMYVCVCVFIYVFMYLYLSMYLCIYVSMYLCMYARWYGCVNMDFSLAWDGSEMGSILRRNEGWPGTYTRPGKLTVCDIENGDYDVNLPNGDFL
jgi:hypothetical protein